MPSNSIEPASHGQIRTILRVGGPIIFLIGLILTVVAFANFFTSLGSFGDFPRYFFLAFIGMPLMFVGGAMTQFGFLGALQRYVASESAPVARDVINTLGQETTPGVKATAKAVTEGILEAQSEAANRRDAG